MMVNCRRCGGWLSRLYVYSCTAFVYTAFVFCTDPLPTRTVNLYGESFRAVPRCREADA